MVIYYKRNKFKSDLQTVDRGHKTGEIRDCDRCGLTWPQVELWKQEGLWVCKYCYDEPDYYRTRRM